MKTVQKIVVKVGTSTLTEGSKKLSRRFMSEFVRQLALLHEAGTQIVLVSSGAIAAGRELLEHPVVDRSLPSKQMFAAIGQVQLMQLWREFFSTYNIHVGQILLTRDDFSHRKRFLNARDTLMCLLHHHSIPIINENDSIATKEIRVGDNDNLAALVANLVGADLLVLLTDQKGLYTADPRLDKNATLIPVVKEIDESIFQLAGSSSTKLGTGGMTTKIEAAQIATRSGTPTVIASSSEPNVLDRLVQGEAIGTKFLTNITPRESKKRWLISEKKQGSIYVDEGATSKILHHGASLLPSGITGVQGNFDRGAVVHVYAPSKELIAVGVSNYSDQEMQKIKGQQSEVIEELLGFSYGHEIIHRTNMTRIKGKENE